jgi:hypothetical protein
VLYASVERVGGVVVTRKFICLAGLIGMVLMLAGCDRCGQWNGINVPSAPRSCHGDPPPN